MSVEVTYPTLAKVPTEVTEAIDRDGYVWRRWLPDGRYWVIPEREGVHPSNAGHLLSEAMADLYGPFYVTVEDTCPRCNKGRDEHTLWGRVWNGDYNQYHAMLWED